MQDGGLQRPKVLWLSLRPLGVGPWGASPTPALSSPEQGPMLFCNTPLSVEGHEVNVAEQILFRLVLTLILFSINKL